MKINDSIVTGIFVYDSISVELIENRLPETCLFTIGDYIIKDGLLYKCVNDVIPEDTTNCIKNNRFELTDKYFKVVSPDLASIEDIKLGNNVNKLITLSGIKEFLFGKYGILKFLAYESNYAIKLIDVSEIDSINYTSVYQVSDNLFKDTINILRTNVLLDGKVFQEYSHINKLGKLLSKETRIIGNDWSVIEFSSSSILDQLINKLRKLINYHKNNSSKYSRVIINPTKSISLVTYVDKLDTNRLDISYPIYLELSNYSNESYRNWITVQSNDIGESFNKSIEYNLHNGTRLSLTNGVITVITNDCEITNLIKYNGSATKSPDGSDHFIFQITG